MMHGHGKSDPNIVAEKPANNAEQSAAELVEPRAGTKGKAGQQSTCRAQDRENVSQALERIRIAARQRKKERFTSLFHHISIELLGDAFSELRRDAAAGVDGLTWRDYEKDLERNLEDLHARVQRGAYRALPSQRRYIPKADGRQHPLAVATIASNCTYARPTFGICGDNSPISPTSRSTVCCSEDQGSHWRGDSEPTPRRDGIACCPPRMDELGGSRHVARAY
jgi:hypothetical protein